VVSTTAAKADSSSRLLALCVTLLLSYEPRTRFAISLSIRRDPPEDSSDLRSENRSRRHLRLRAPDLIATLWFRCRHVAVMDSDLRADSCGAQWSMRSPQFPYAHDLLLVKFNEDRGSMAISRTDMG